MYGFSSTLSTVKGRSGELVRERSRCIFGEHEDCRRWGSVFGEVATLCDPLALERRESRVECARLERADDVPVPGRDEPHSLPFAVDDEPSRDRLHAAGRQSRHHLLPEDGRDLVAVQAVEDAPRLLCVDEPVVYRAGLVQSARDRVLRDLVEDHSPDGNLRLQHLDEMPGDCFAFAILVRGEQEFVGVGEALLQVGDHLLLAGVDDVVRLEPVVDVDTECPEPLALRFRYVLGPIREIAHMADARPHGVAAAEVTLDRPRLGG